MMVDLCWSTVIGESIAASQISLVMVNSSRRSIVVMVNSNSQDLL